jgi:hypothetical protein
MNAFTAIVGLVTAFAAYSIICSALVEWLSATLGLRPRLLRHSLRRLLRGGAIHEAVVTHPMLEGLRLEDRARTYPDYVAPETFALALMSVAMKFTPAGPGIPGTVAVNPKPNWTTDDLTLAEAMVQGTSNVGPVQARLEEWFKDSMETISGQYKRQTQLLTLVAASAVTFALQFDTLGTFAALGGRPPSGLALPTASGYVLSIIGLSFGAPFWFDLLKRLVNLRQTGLPPDEKPK